MKAIAQAEFQAVEALLGVLSMLRGTGKGGLQVETRTSNGFGADTLFIDSVPAGFLPPALMRAIKEDFSLRIRPAVVSAGGPALRLNAVFAHWKLTPVFGKRTWEVSKDEIARVLEPMQRFSLSPTALVDATTEVVAFWQVDSPLDLRNAQSKQKAVDLLARIAAALDACAPPNPFDDTIPLGGPVCNMGAMPPTATIPWMDPQRVYSIAALEGALEEMKR